MSFDRLSKMGLGFSLIITLLVFFLLGNSGSHTGLWWVSLFMLVLVEMMVYRISAYVVKHSKLKSSIPAQLLFIILTLFYAAVVIFHLLFFWLALEIALSSYIIIHLVTFAAWALGMGVARYFTNYVRDQEELTAVQTDLIKQMQISLLSIKQNLTNGNQAGREELKNELNQLIEQVKYSDPISKASMMDVEGNLRWQMTSLEQSVSFLIKHEGDTGNIEVSRQLVADLAADLIKRNSQLKALK